MNGKTTNADVIAPVMPIGLLSTARALWAALRRSRRPERPVGRLAEVDARLLKDIGYAKSNAIAVAAERLPAADVARYRDQL